MSATTIDCVITIGGEAGQGMQTLGVLLSKILLKWGYHCSTLQSYQSRIRGGHNYFQVRVASGPVHSLRNGTDILVALDDNTIRVHGHALADRSVVLFDRAKVKAPVPAGEPLELDMSRLLPGAGGKEASANVVYLGAILGLLGVEEEAAEGLMAGIRGNKETAVIAENRGAWQAGLRYLSGRDGWQGRFPVPAPSAPGNLLVLHGNQALALGAMAAGCTFFSAYPMTPSTSIFETLAAFASKSRMVVEQAEDEIAALNMVLGASYAGARAMTATSGGGFALMVEALSLAGMLECPAVIVDAQRPGPATGLPTRTEQGDLEFVVHAGHGEFPRAVLTPGNHQDCFDLMPSAFNLADRYQIPVIVLTDQYLADLYGAASPFSLDTVIRDRGRLTVPSGDYVRYQVTADGVSPRAFPGKGPGVVIADSDEHTEDGHLTEDLDVRLRMHEKRLAKYGGLTDEMILPEIWGADRQNMVICWGSTWGPCRDAVAQLQNDGRRVSMMHFKQVWPLNGAIIQKLLAPCANLICVEGNAQGQFARLLLRETGVHVHARILRYDGTPFLQDELARDMAEYLK